MTIIQKHNILKLVGSITTYNYGLMHIIVDFLNQDDNIKCLKESEWIDSWKQKNTDIYPLDLKNKDIWINFNRCIEFNFEPFNETKICLEVKHYNGDSLNGNRQKVNWTAIFHLPLKFLDNIENQINSALDNLAEDAYDLHLETQKLTYINNFKEEMLKIKS